MMYFIIIFEVLAVMSLLLFNGILDSKYYEKMPIKAVSNGVSYACMALTAVFVVRFLQIGEVSWTWLPAAMFCGHLVLNVLMVIVLLVAWERFSVLPLKFAKQYLFARGALGFSIVFEVLALLFVIIYYAI